MNNKLLETASVIVAGLASLCCIGPLVAAGLGLGVFAVASAFEELRPYFLGITAVLLAGAFYLTYRRRTSEACADGVCKTALPNRSQKLLLWLTTAFVVTLAAFPHYSGRVWGNFPGSDAAALAAGPSPRLGLAEVVFTVDGMTCAGCAAGLKAALQRQPGVELAKVNYQEGTAHVSYETAKTSPRKLAAVVEELGFVATFRRVPGGGE